MIKYHCPSCDLDVAMSSCPICGMRTTSASFIYWCPTCNVPTWEEKCPVCGKVILPYAGKSVAEIKEISKRNLGQVMCGECMRNKAKEGKGE